MLLYLITIIIFVIIYNYSWETEMIQEIELICFDETCIYNNIINHICTHGQPFVEIESERTCRCISYEQREYDEEN